MSTGRSWFRSSAVLGLAAVSLAVSAPVAIARQDSNAADWYQRAIEKTAWLTEEDRDLIREFHDEPDREVTPEIRAILDRAESAMAIVSNGSRREYSDFNLDYSQGFELLLPHLSELRNLARLMVVDANRRMAAGDAPGAADRIASLYRLSSHLGDDRTMISSLVGMSIFDGADEVVRRGMEQAAFDRQTGALLLESTRWLESEDPFGVTNAVMMEQILTVGWVERKFKEGKLSEAVDFYDDERSHDLVEQLDGLSPQEFEAHMEGYDALMTRVVNAFMMDDPTPARTELDRIEEAIVSGEYGLIASLFTPALGRLYEMQQQATTMIDSRRSALADLASGEVAPEQLANAATWYLKAVRIIESMSDADRQVMRETPIATPLDESASSVLDAAQSAVQLMEEGSNMRRCDFAAAGADETTLFMPSYLPALRDGFRLIVLDAARRRKRERLAADRLAIAIRMSAHLELDRRLLTSSVAHGAFGLAIEFAAQPAPEGSEPWSEGSLEVLRDAVGRVSPSDPFGYLGAAEHARERLVDRLLALTPDDGITGESEVGARVKSMLGQLNANPLLYVAFVTELPPDEPDEEQIPHPAGQLAPLVLADSLDIARSDATPFRSLLEQGKLDAIIAMTSLPLTNVATDASAVRRDLRRAWRAVAPSPPKEPVIEE